MKILLDTHVFLWLRTQPDKIPPQVLAAYHDITTDVFLSMASIWEMQIKFQLGKLELTMPLAQLIDEQTNANGLQILAIEQQHIFALAELPFHHKDPFDRLILVQSQWENLHLCSADGIFSDYGATLFW